VLVINHLGFRPAWLIPTHHNGNSYFISEWQLTQDPICRRCCLNSPFVIFWVAKCAYKNPVLRLCHFESHFLCYPLDIVHVLEYKWDELYVIHRIICSQYISSRHKCECRSARNVGIKCLLEETPYLPIYMHEYLLYCKLYFCSFFYYTNTYCLIAPHYHDYGWLFMCFYCL